MKGKTCLRVLLALDLAWTTSLFLAPFTIEPGSARGLDGAANFVDHEDLWSTFGPYPRVVYWIGDLNCHQMEARSWILHGNQIPVDARMTAIFVAANAGLALALLVPSLPRARDEFVQVLPTAWRARLATPRARLLVFWGCVAAAALPCILEVGAQLSSGFESTNLRRAVWGALLGLVGGYATGVVFDSLWTPGTARGQATGKADATGAD